MKNNFDVNPFCKLPQKVRKKRKTCSNRLVYMDTPHMIFTNSHLITIITKAIIIVENNAPKTIDGAVKKNSSH
jgi:hypothetical protein